MPLDDARAAKTEDDQGLIRTGLAIHPGQNPQQENQRQYSESDKENQLVRHWVPDPFNRECEFVNGFTASSRRSGRSSETTWPTNPAEKSPPGWPYPLSARSCST